MNNLLDRFRRRDAEYGPFLDRIKFDSLTVDEDGAIDLKLIEEYDEDTSKAVLHAVVVSLIRMLGKAENYVEMRVRSGRFRGKEYVVTVGRGGHPTPHELRRRAEAERDEALAKLAGHEAGP